MKNFYNQLYTSQHQPSAERFSNFSDYESLPKLDNEKQNLCEGLITTEECLAALKTFQHNKTPGKDVVTAEFYLCFWNDISGPFIGLPQSWCPTRRASHLSEARNHLLDPNKEKKTPYCLKTGALATKCIATRLEKVLPHLIESDQTGYIDSW